MLLCICKGPRKGANYCTEETMCSLQLSSQPGKQTKIPTTCTLCWYTLVCFPGCTLCWYFGTFSWLYTLLVFWYVFLVVHLVGILVPTLGWYLGMFCWLYSIPLLVFWYLGNFSWLYTLLVSWYVILVVNLAVNLHTVSSVQ